MFTDKPLHAKFVHPSKVLKIFDQMESILTAIRPVYTSLPAFIPGCYPTGRYECDGYRGTDSQNDLNKPWWDGAVQISANDNIYITRRQVPYRVLHNIPMVTAAFEEIRLLFADLDGLEENIDDFLPLLSADEITRANSYVAPTHQKSFVIARGLLRIVLGACLGIAPWKIMFSYNAFGKPFINGPLNKRGLRFNLAHSGAAAVIALAIGCEVGVDIEKIRTVAEMDQIAGTIFTPTEKEFFDAAEGSKKQMLFFTYWTRKEAAVKAAGHGLTQPLETIDVSACPANPVFAPDQSGSSSGFSRLFIQDFAFANNYSASIAVEQYPRGVRSFFINWNL